MSVYNQIPWLAVGGALTALGLILSWLTARRRGAAAGLRGAAWSLLPLAAALTGAIKMLWRMGVAVGDFAASFIFSPLVWGGVVVTGLAVVLFVVSGAMRGRRGRKGETAGPRQPAVPGAQPGKALGTAQSRPAATGKGKGKAVTPADEDFGEVADILRKHGIK